MAEFRIRQKGITAASVSGPDEVSSEGEILHYAMQYRRDGELTIERKVLGSTGGAYWKRHMLMAIWPPVEPLA
jgi:hypothetical protein